MTRLPRIGVSGRIAAAFLDSRLTPLTIVTSVLLGLLALATLPREEEPQIQVPMVDIHLAWPGQPVVQVERQLTTPIERRLSEIPGLEYLYSTSRDDGALIIARFRVGMNSDQALTRIHTRLQQSSSALPPGASVASVAPRSIDDVPVLALTLWSASQPGLDQNDLRRVAAELAVELQKAPGVARVDLLGGEPREITVAPDPAAMAHAGVTVGALVEALGSAGVSRAAGEAYVAGTRTELRAESALRSAEEIRSLPLRARDGRTLRVSEVASVTAGPGEPTQYVFLGGRDGARHPAVTVQVAKLPGVNATRLVRFLHRRVDELRPSLLGDLEVETTRDYGRTAQHKSDDLIFHLMLATLSVVALIALALGRREAVVVAVAIPVTLALTLFLYGFLGYTLNRVTLFALIFSIGILVDDAIVVVENIARHFRLRDGRSVDDRVIAAVDEVGNPTVLATITVIAAILPLAFVGGLMGPYMKPIPVGASLAMIFSLAVAFVISPWAARRVLVAGGHGHGAQGAEGRLDRLYRALMRRLLEDRRWRRGFFAAITVLLVGSVSLLALRVVTVKVLPFDNKSEFDVLVDLPPGAPLENTLAVADAMADRLLADPDVERAVIYAGLGSPITFNGLVRHYDFRREARFASVQVELREAGKRKAQSHAIARRLRAPLEAIAASSGARVKVVEVPPGPPVLSTLVAEVYGPDLEGQRRLARQVWDAFRDTPGVVDTDLLVTEGQPVARIEVDRERAGLAGADPAAVTAATTALYAGHVAGVLRAPEEAEAVPIRVRLAAADRGDLSALEALRVGSAAGTPLSEVTRQVAGIAPPEIHHKNMQRVVYVLGDVAGRTESPVYAIADLRPRVAALTAPDGRPVHQLSTRLPGSDEGYSLKWDGEWHITYEVFRDMGAAFAVVLVLIYVLVVGWFKSFTTPLVIMIPIPLSLVGILPAHALMGAFFTATSMIGFIAGAGITVRNSIILVDFIERRRAEGMPLRDAVIDAGAVRFRPMVLTAAAVGVGASVILFDPIFQGLAVALIGGEVAATALSRMVVPVLYERVRRGDARIDEPFMSPTTPPAEQAA